MSGKLTPKQQKFVDEYLIDLNATQAAMRAGYSPHTATEQASRLLTNVKVQEAVEQGKKRLADKVQISQEWVLGNLKTIAERCMQSAPVTGKDGKRVFVETDTGDIAAAYEFNAPGATRSLELLGKHVGLFKEGSTVVINNNAPLPQRDRDLLDDYAKGK